MSKQKYFIYARKSTESEDRQVRSIGDQLAELREIARRDQLLIAEELVESQTAKEPGRPVFNAMVKRIEKNEAAGILAWHPDRLARNSIDGGRIIHLVDTGLLTDLRFSTFWFEPTPQGKFMLAIAFGQSKYYVDNLSENIRRGQRQKLKNGIWPIVAPLGYLNDHKTKTIIPDPVRAPLIKKTFELYATGECTLDTLTATMTELGLTARTGNRLSRTQYHRLIQNPLYYGLIRYGGESYDGSHEPIVSKSLFDQVQQVIHGRHKTRVKELKPFTYRKIFRCGNCGGVITHELQKGHVYLRCTKKLGKCDEPYVREEAINTQVDAALSRVALPQEQLDEMNTQWQSEQHDKSARQEKHRITIQRKIADLDAKLDRLTNAYVENTLSLDEYRGFKNKLVEEKTTLKELLADAGKNHENWLEPLTGFLNSLQEATLLQPSNDYAEKAKFLKKHGSNLTIRAKQTNCEFHEPYRIVEKHGRFAQPEPRASATDARVVGESAHVFTNAESVRQSSNVLQGQSQLGLLTELVDLVVLPIRAGIRARGYPVTAVLRCKQRS